MERKSNCNIFPDMWGNPLAKITCIFLPVCKIIFNDILFFIRDSHCRQCYFLCLRLFLKVASLMILAKLSVQKVSHTTLKSTPSTRGCCRVTLWCRMRGFCAREVWDKAGAGWGSPYSMSCVHSIFGRPYAWINRMSKLFSCSEFQDFVPSVGWSYFLL